MKRENNHPRQSHDSSPSPDPHPDRAIRPRGNYRDLLSFQKAEVVFDLTFRFAHKYLPRGDRTRDQMIQAARSGKKNILEGSKDAVVSKKIELSLTGTARGSLEELLDDYLDFLRVRDLRIWDKDSPEALYVRKLGRKVPLSFEDFREFFDTRPPEVTANIAICLIHQANYLLDRQIERLDKDFVQEGGFSERLYRVRTRHRKGYPPRG